MNPFDKYEGKGKKLLGEIIYKGSSRKGYGIPVFRQCGLKCVYCNMNFLVYENWLNISIDHVIPTQSLKYWKDKEEIEHNTEINQWIDDISNVVTSCRACNEFLNGYRINKKNHFNMPRNLKDFYNLRNKVFAEKKNLAIKKHFKEKEWFKNEIEKKIYF